MHHKLQPSLTQFSASQTKVSDVLVNVSEVNDQLSECLTQRLQAAWTQRQPIRERGIECDWQVNDAAECTNDAAECTNE
jgi:hypothetical protein